MRIDRCVCVDVTFEELLARSAREGLAVEAVIELEGVSGCCGMCRPYVRRACRTGQTVFFEALSDADEPGEGLEGPGQRAAG
ncbi:MAG: (2Fe-2S)-binding protein [Planctomycetota bacterium]